MGRSLSDGVCGWVRGTGGASHYQMLTAATRAAQQRWLDITSVFGDVIAIDVVDDQNELVWRGCRIAVIATGAGAMATEQQMNIEINDSLVAELGEAIRQAEAAEARVQELETTAERERDEARAQLNEVQRLYGEANLHINSLEAQLAAVPVKAIRAMYRRFWGVLPRKGAMYQNGLAREVGEWLAQQQETQP